jgi:hypothetical protein
MKHNRYDVELIVSAALRSKFLRETLEFAGIVFACRLRVRVRCEQSLSCRCLSTEIGFMLLGVA